MAKKNVSRTATKEFTFDAAHMLSGHNGLCRNLHGHTYRVEVTVSYGKGEVIPDGPSEGMIIDFKKLKTKLNEDIFDKMDHAYIYNSLGGVDENAIADLCKTLNMKVYDMANRPTAENMAEYFLGMANTSLQQFDVEVISVRVWETPTSYAESNR